MSMNVSGFCPDSGKSYTEISFTSWKMWLSLTSHAPCFIGWRLPVQSDKQGPDGWTLIWVCHGENKQLRFLLSEPYASSPWGAASGFRKQTWQTCRWSELPLQSRIPPWSTCSKLAASRRCRRVSQRLGALCHENTQCKIFSTVIHKTF